MKNLLTLMVAFFMVTLLAGCGSTKFLVKAPNGDALLPADPDTVSAAAPKQNVKLVLIQRDGNKLFNADQKNAVAQLKEMMDATGHFGTVTVNAAALYWSAIDIPKPANGDLSIGLTLSTGYKPDGFLPTLGKTVLSLATLTLSSTVLPYVEGHTSHVTLSVVGEDGPVASYAAETVGQARWTPWTFQIIASRNSRMAVRTNAMTSALNQMLAETKKS